MVAGLIRGLDHEDAARFAFLLATPIIVAAGVYKLPALFGHLGDGVRMQSLVEHLRDGRSVRVDPVPREFFRTQTLWPFGGLLPARRHRLHDPLRLNRDADEQRQAGRPEVVGAVRRPTATT